MKMTNCDKAIKNFWDREVGNFYKDAPSEYLYNFFSKIKNKKSKKVLDLGCGAGRNTMMLNRLGFIVYGCDFNKKMVLATQKRLPGDIRKGIIVSDMVSLPYADNYFDFVVSNGVFHNAKSLNDFCSAIKEGCRVLKEGSRLILNTFIDGNPKDKLKKSRKEKYLYFTKDSLPIILLPTLELVYLFSENGLKILSSWEGWVTVSTGKRKIFKGIFSKQKNGGKNNLHLINLRFLIDEIDKSILSSISRRAVLVRKILQYKKKMGIPFYDCKRERKVEEKLIQFSNSEKFNFKKETIKEITEFLLKISKKESQQ